MLKYHFLLVFTCFFLGNIYSQTTAIPDAKFEQVLIDLGIDTDDTINQSVLTSDISGVTTLEVSGKDISDLTGIEGFSSLTYLDSRNNQLTSLDVSQNIVLSRLYAYSNPLLCVQVDNVAEANARTGIYRNWRIEISARYSEDCNNTTWIPDANFEQTLIDLGIDTDGIINQSVSTSDISGVTSLDVSSRNISNLRGIKDFKNLTYFDCSDNQLTSLNLQNGNNSLITYFDSRLNLSIQCIQVDNAGEANAGIGSYSTWLKDSSNTYSDDCPKTYVPDNGLEFSLIRKGYDDIMDDFVLTSNISSITYLRLSDYDNYFEPYFYYIKDITGIKDFISLETLRFSEIQHLDNIDLSNHPSLKGVIFNELFPQSVDLSNCTALIGLSGTTFTAESIYLSNCTALSYINLKSPPLNLDLSTCTALTSLTLYGGLLTSLNVKNGNNSILTSFSVPFASMLTCIDVDNKTDADAGNGSYSTWVKPDTSFYSEDCASALGVDDEVLEQGISLYPNPVSDILTIDSEIPLTKVEIYSVLGRKVKEINSDFTSIPTDNLSNGVYIVRILSENGVTSKKLIKH